MVSLYSIKWLVVITETQFVYELNSLIRSMKGANFIRKRKNFRVTYHLVNEQNVEVEEHLINVGCSSRRQQGCLVLLTTEHLVKEVQC